MIIRVSVPNLFLDKNTSQYKLLIYKILDRKSTRLNSSHREKSRMPSSA